jgi:hypothetical protein
VIIPTVAPNQEVEECLISILRQTPAKVFMVTVGNAMLVECENFFAPLRRQFPATEISVHAIGIANKRLQVAYAIRLVTTPITVMADDHVFWMSPNFLPSILAPFESPRVGLVGVNKEVRRPTPGVLVFGI